MEPLRLSYREALIYAILINAFIGFLLGLIPMLVGFFKQKKRLGVFGLLSSTFGGAILGIFLSIPAVAVFLWLILKKPSAETSAADESDNETEII